MSRFLRGLAKEEGKNGLNDRENKKGDGGKRNIICVCKCYFATFYKGLILQIVSRHGVNYAAMTGVRCLNIQQLLYQT